MVSKETRLDTKKLLTILSEAGERMVFVAIPCAVAGLVVGTASLTGLTPAISGFLSSLTKDQVFLTLFVTMIMSIILGMGVPTTANYILMNILTIPLLLKAGITPIAAHLFCFHFGIMSELTPPVAITSYTASAIARAEFWPTAFTAVKLASVAYIVPYFFVYQPNLLLGTQPFSFQVVQTVVFSVMGCIAFSSGIAGYLFRKMNTIERILMCIAAFLMIDTRMISDIIGVVIAGAVILIQIFNKKGIILTSERE